MINSVSGVSFGNNVNATQDLINSPGKYTNVTTPEVPADSYESTEKKSSAKKGIIATLLIGLAAFAGLGYAVKSGKLSKVTEMPEGFFNKAWAKTKNVGHSIGKAAANCWDTVAGWFGKGAKAAEKATKEGSDAANKVADEVAEAAADAAENVAK